MKSFHGWTRHQLRLAAFTVIAGGVTASALVSGAGDLGVEPSALHAAAEAGVRPLLAAQTATLERKPLNQAVDALRGEVERGAFPGAAFAAGRGASLSLIEAVGTTNWHGDEVDAERTVYDLASLTKVVATTTAAMLLYEDGRLQLDAPVTQYLPSFSGGQKDDVTVRDLLTHTSGLPAGAPARGSTPAERLASIIATPLKRSIGASVEYSDVGFIALYEALEKAAGEPLPELLSRRVYEPLGMEATRFAPGPDCELCAPTRKVNGKPTRGVVHDPTARALGGVTGNAGLFSSAADLSRFAAMLAGRGELEGVRVLKAETIDTFTIRQPGAGNRALGWETAKEDGTGAAGRSMSPRAFGHTGYTGTSLWVDPELGTWAVLLTNRTYDAQASNQIQRLRRTVHGFVTDAAPEALGE